MTKLADAPFRLHLEADPADYLEVKVDWAAGCDRAMYTCACGLVFEDVAELVAHLYAHNARRVFVNPVPLGNNGHGITPFEENDNMAPEKPEQLPAEPRPTPGDPHPEQPIADPDRRPDDRPDRPERPGPDRPLPRPKG